MSPELIDPQRFGFKKSRPTKSSDCYALGMVIYETVSGNLPFHEHTDPTVVMKVLKGEHPPRGTRFTRSLWKMLELCWTFQLSDRPSIEDVLRGLEMASNLSEPPLPGADEEMEGDGGDWDGASGSLGVDEELENDDDDWGSIYGTPGTDEETESGRDEVHRPSSEKFYSGDSDRRSVSSKTADHDTPASEDDGGGRMEQPEVDDPKSPTSKRTSTPSTRSSSLPFDPHPVPFYNETRPEGGTSGNQPEAPAPWAWPRPWPLDSKYDNVETENGSPGPIDQLIQEQELQSGHRKGSSLRPTPKTSLAKGSVRLPRPPSHRRKH